MSATEFPKFCISWGAYREFHFREKFTESLFIHAVYISSCVHSDHWMVLVGSPGECVNWELKVFSLWSPGGSNMVNYLKHIYSWWIWLSDSIFIDVGVIFTLQWHLDKISSLASFLGLAYLVEVSYFVTFLALCILGWTFLSWLVLWLSTSHVLPFHSWGFSRQMAVT